MTDEQAGFEAAFAEPPVEQPEFNELAEQQPPEPPAPVQPQVDIDAIVEAVTSRMMAGQRQQQQYQPAPVEDAPPNWDTFDGTLDQYVQAQIEYDRRKSGNGLQQAMTAMQESQYLSQVAAVVPPEVSQTAAAWFNGLPPEHLKPGVAKAIVAHALGMHQLDQALKRGPAKAPTAVADAGVPSGGYQSPEAAAMRAHMQAAFPHLSPKEISEILKNG